ncbi:MAG TPA: HEPN domain-containing protein [Candidatus Tripitaka sp. YC43]
MKEALVRYRMEQAHERLRAAEALLSQGLYTDSVTRSYYAMFTAARALLATKGLDSAKHSGVISLFNQHFVKTGIVEKTMSGLIAKAKGLRERGDYELYRASEEVAKEQLDKAGQFVKAIKKVLAKED